MSWGNGSRKLASAKPPPARRATVDRPHVRVRLEPGCGERIVFEQARYAEQPTFTFGCGSFATTSMFITVHELDTVGRMWVRGFRHPMPLAEP